MLAILWIFFIGLVLLTLLARTISWADESPEKLSICMQTPHPIAVNYPLLSPWVFGEVELVHLFLHEARWHAADHVTRRSLASSSAVSHSNFLV